MRVDDSVQVPREYVKDGEIVLNVGIDATNALQLGNDYIEFTARFGGKPRDIMVPVGRVIAIYARENGQGMAFPAPAPAVLQSDAGGATGGLAVVEDQAPSTADDAKVVQLVPSDAAEPADTDNTDPPRPSPASGGQRPALKRVK